MLDCVLKVWNYVPFKDLFVPVLDAVTPGV